MATLFNTKIKDTYQSLLKLEDNTILTTTTKNITDGLGNASPLFMSTTRVGIGTNNPTGVLHVVSTEVMGGNNGGQIVLSQSGANSAVIGIQGSGWNTFGIWGISRFTTTSVPDLRVFASGIVSVFNNSLLVGAISTSTAKFHVRGGGSSSATTALIVDNSSGNAALEITDDRTTTISGTQTNLSTGKVFVGALSLTASGTQNTGNGIYSTGGDGTVVIATSNGGSTTSGGVQMSSWGGGNIALVSVNKSLLSIINSGFSDGNIDNLSGNTLLMQPTYNFSGARSGIIVRGIYYNPTLTSLTNTTHIAIQTVTGNVLLGTTSGNVGIGTSSPTTPLTIAKSGSNNYFNFEPSATGVAPYIQALNSGNVDGRLYFGSSLQVRAGSSTSPYGLDCGGITSSGNIFVGGGKIEIASATNNFIQFTDLGAINIGVIGTADATSYIQVRTGNAISMSSGTLSTAFFNSGNVGIGTTTDNGYKLNVNGTTFVSELITTGGIVKHNPYTPGIRALEIYSGIGHGGNTGVWSSMYQVGVYGNGWDNYYQTQGIGVQGDPNNNSSAGSVVNLGVYGGAALSNATGIYGTSGLFGKATNLRNASAALEVNSTTHGFLPPRMTAAQRTSVTTITGFGTITGGSGYVDGTYQAVSITGGSGQNAYARIIVSGGSVTSVTLESSLGGLTGGFGYTNGASVSASNTQLGGTGAGFSVIANASTPVGMMVYQTDMVEGLYIYKSTGWTFII
jgi:hypothetical protein